MSQPKIRVGLAIPPKPPLASIKQVIYAARFMRFDCLMLWDHLQDIFPKALWEKSFTWAAGENESPHEFFDQQTLLGYIAPKAGRLQIGVAVTDPMRRHPVIIAQSMITLAHLSKRAPILGIGAGEMENLVPYGFPVKNTVSRLEEALQVIRLCFDSKEPITFQGTYFQLENAPFDLRAPEGRTPQIWVGALGPRMLELTGKYGDGWYPLGLLSPQEYGERLETIRGVARAAGRNPDAIVPSLQPYIVVAPTHEEAEQLLNSKTIRYFGLLVPADIWRKHGFSHPFGEDFRGVLDFMPEKYSRKDLEEAIALVPTEIGNAGLLWGTPKEIAQQLRAYGDAGLRHVVPQAMTAAISRKAALYSLRALRQIANDLK